jgi:hypothetical protein
MPMRKQLRKHQVANEFELCASLSSRAHSLTRHVDFAFSFFKSFTVHDVCKCNFKINPQCRLNTEKRRFRCVRGHRSMWQNNAVAAARGDVTSSQHTSCSYEISRLISISRGNSQNNFACALLDRTTALGSILGSYLASKTELDDRATHLVFSANRWEGQ